MNQYNPLDAAVRKESRLCQTPKPLDILVCGENGTFYQRVRNVLQAVPYVESVEFVQTRDKEELREKVMGRTALVIARSCALPLGWQDVSDYLSRSDVPPRYDIIVMGSSASRSLFIGSESAPCVKRNGLTLVYIVDPVPGSEAKLKGFTQVALGKRIKK